MAKKMLIDATHAEETRVVVVDGHKVEEFDFESENKRQLAGNIYLAKVTRVEPSLQAAFVDYGGNRHGFLAFSEIHPDYYQIPVADREALMAEERAYAEALKAREDEDPKPARRRRRSRRRSDETSSESDTIAGMETIDLSDEDTADSMVEPVMDSVESATDHSETSTPVAEAPETPVEDTANESVDVEPAADTSEAGEQPAEPQSEAASVSQEDAPEAQPEPQPEPVPAEAETPETDTPDAEAAPEVASPEAVASDTAPQEAVVTDAETPEGGDVGSSAAPEADAEPDTTDGVSDEDTAQVSVPKGPMAMATESDDPVVTSDDVSEAEAVEAAPAEA
ncbi:MAG: hypothetical protein ACPGVS_08905, partial [Primorskyibacter sp.]